MKLSGTWLRGLAVLAALWALWTLEGARLAVPERQIETTSGLVSLYGAGDGPLVIVAHGFAGSTRMMQSLSRDLARAGFRAAAFDFAGHGRSRALMSSDVTRIEGTTEQLVAQTVAITRALRAELGWSGPVALLGHSMATDIVIRAATELEDVAAVIAISMYSEAVTATSPERLLILSGEWETRLRAVALEAVRMVAPAAGEGQTVTAGPVTRRSAVAPNVEHVGVLYSTSTMKEARNWLSEALDVPTHGQARSEGRAILTLLISLIVLGSALPKRLPKARGTRPPLPLRDVLITAFVPVLPAMAAAWAFGGAVFGVAAFGHLLAFFLVWGVVALGLLLRAGHKPERPDPAGIIVLMAMCLVFALALDRYGAAFVPVGARAGIMAALMVGTVPFMLADQLLVDGAALWRRIVLRLLPIVALLALMLWSPQPFGLLFTVLPVMVLFYAVFGTMGRMVAMRTGPGTSGIALGVVLAWSIAASQPLFDAAM